MITKLQRANHIYLANGLVNFNSPCTCEMPDGNHPALRALKGAQLMKRMKWMPLLASLLAAIFLNADFCGAQTPDEAQTPDAVQTTDAAQTTKLTDSELADLMVRINSNRKSGSATLRNNVSDVYRLADYYLEQGNDERASQLFIYALEVDGWNLTYQLKLARLLLKQGNKQQAMEKAQYVWKFAEDDALLEEAKLLLADMGLKTPEIEQQTSPSSDQRPEIVLVPIGAVNRRILTEVIAEFGSGFGINFSIGDIQVAAGEPDRNMAERALDESITNMKTTIPPEMYAQMLAATGLTEDGLKTFANKKALTEKYFELAGAPPDKENAAAIEALAVHPFDQFRQISMMVMPMLVGFLPLLGDVSNLL